MQQQQHRLEIAGGFLPPALSAAGETRDVYKRRKLQSSGVEIAPANEINGLTLGAVGRGSTIEYVEVFNNSDDGVEFFGGTVNTAFDGPRNDAFLEAQLAACRKLIEEHYPTLGFPLQGRAA